EKRSPVLMSYLASDVTRNLFGRTPEIDRVVRGYLEARLRDQVSIEQQGRGAAVQSDLSLKGLVKSLAFPTVRNQLLYPRFGAHDQVLSPNDEDLDGLDWGLYMQILKTAKRRVESWGGRMVIMIIPFENNAGFLDPNRYVPARAYRDKLTQAFRTVGLQY